jgi:hyperosmotically inducible protein
MFRALLRLIVVLVVLVAAAAFFLGYWGSSRVRPSAGEAPIATSGHVDTERAREAGARVGAKTAEAANRAGELLADGALTAKIKSKMALDDTVEARAIDITTRDGVVTLSGRVATEAEHAKALQLARETDGVKQVVDQMSVGR